MLKIVAALLLSVLAGSAGAVTLLTAALANANENPPTNPTTAAGAPRSASFGTGNNTTFAAQLANILAGRAYINFHTTQFGGGEIRGNLVVAVPEPETYALLIAGLAIIAGAARRRGRAARAPSAA